MVEQKKDKQKRIRADVKLVEELEDMKNHNLKSLNDVVWFLKRKYDGKPVKTKQVKTTMVKLKWNICQSRRCKYYENKFPGGECNKGLTSDEIKTCQNTKNIRV